MSETMRGFVLLLSVLLWLPVLRPLLDGQMRTDEAVLRYAGALLLAWGGVSLIAAILKAYSPEPAPEEEPAATTAPVAPPAPTAATATATAPMSTGADAGPSDSDDLLPDGTPRRRAEDVSR